MSRGYLLVRRDGALWGLDNAAVESLTHAAGGFRIGVRAGELCIDEIVGVVADLTLRPLASALCRFWPDGAGGAARLAIHAEMPLVVVDPQRPPRALCGPDWKAGDPTAGDPTGDKAGQGVGTDA